MQDDAPLFLISPLQRSGTNFLARVLIAVDGTRAVPVPFAEGRFLDNAALLEEYCDRTLALHRVWIEGFGGNANSPDDYREAMLGGLGEGLLDFVRKTSGRKRPLLKSPIPGRIDLLFSLFSSSRLIIQFRDGRDTVESYLRTWPGPGQGSTRRALSAMAHIVRRGSMPKSHRRKVIEKWVTGVRRILDFMEENRDEQGKRFMVVRYEDLLRDQRGEVERIAAFLGRGTDEIRWDQLGEIPLMGSSSNRGADGRHKWGPLEKPPDFAPVGRWSGWSKQEKDLFRRIAGSELIELGYESGDSW